MMWLLKWLTGDLAGALTRAYQAKLAAQNDQDRLVAEAVIKGLETQVEQSRLRADVVREGMQHSLFWIPWLIAAVPMSAWFGWGMLDSLIYAGTVLPDVAALPPQLKAYADVVFDNIFYSGAGMAGVQMVAKAIRTRT